MSSDDRLAFIAYGVLIGVVGLTFLAAFIGSVLHEKRKDREAALTGDPMNPDALTQWRIANKETFR